MRGGDLKSMRWAVAFTLRPAQSCGGSVLQVRCQSAGHVDITIHQAVKKNPPPLVAPPFLCVFSLPSSLSFRCCDCSSALQAPFCWRVSPRWPNVGSARTSNCLRTAQVHNRTQLRTCTAAARLLLQVNVVRLYFAAVVSHLALARIHASSARSVCTKPAHLSLINCIPCFFFSENCTNKWGKITSAEEQKQGNLISCRWPASGLINTPRYICCYYMWWALLIQTDELLLLRGWLTSQRMDLNDHRYAHLEPRLKIAE